MFTSAIRNIRVLRVLIDTCSLMKACEELGENAARFFRDHFSGIVGGIQTRKLSFPARFYVNWSKTGKPP